MSEQTELLTPVYLMTTLMPRRTSSHYGQPEVRHMARLDSQPDVFDEDMPFRALRESMSRPFGDSTLLIPFSQLTLQTGNLSGHLLFAFRKSADFAVCFASCRAVIHTG